MLNLDFFGNSFFLKKLFPNGIENHILIKDISIVVNGNSCLSFFIKQKPEIDVKKWGEFGIDFNAFWIKTSNNINFSKVIVENIQDLGFSRLEINSNNFCPAIHSSNDNSRLLLILEKNHRFIIQDIVPIMISA